MIFKGESDHYYIRLQFNKNEKGLDRRSFTEKETIGVVTFNKLSIVRVEEFNLKTDLKLGMFVD